MCIRDRYISSDLLITDYSSVFFDYANLKKPMIFYMYDLAAYRDEIRGFYLGLEELPGPIVETEEELISVIPQVLGLSLIHISATPPMISWKWNQSSS